MIRVGVDARPLAHLNSGIGQYTQKILEALNRSSKLEIVLYSRDLPQAVPAGMKTRTAASSWIPNSLFAQLVFPIWAKRDRLDLFWSPRHHLPLVVLCPCVVTIHDMVWKKHPETMHRGGALLERLLMPPSVRKACAVICVSESTRADLLSLMPSAQGKCHVIYEAACQSPQSDIPTTVDGSYFLFVGTKEPRKNLEFCLEAWARSGLAEKGFKLILAGGKGWKMDLDQLLRQKQLVQSVRSVSPDSAMLEKLYAGCFAVVLPSIYEGFGLPLVEGMAFGKPIITSNVSAMPEIAGDAALLVSPVNVDELVGAFRRLTEDQNLYRLLAQNSLARNAQFDWHKAGEQTLEVIQRVVLNSS